ncbi:putative peptidoglycan lipid II flippase [Halopolyspora algeriensis]|uniref:Putative peptidoglycan lipid II flippase n=1 Tax=Halopolyspora algeriensis TaxID=1500506 RepID=A0A368VZ79_9ACTN|nr:murein biosynthesis integral membrane protein MurJ [Halopolyspora algeriensis]RCW46142.1 putative peptidoglycan lipid II flippase [Halopolyspora algeriensis]TQM55545.1 putative peptidoglycan lipid II flippase [Halopolyspora algeriensis]
MVDQAKTPAGTRSPSLGRASGAMAIATLTSRISGLLAKILLVAVLGLSIVNDSYTVANTLPTVINELLLGGVLTSIAVPLLVRAQQDSPEYGESYAQWMMTMAAVLLAVATLLAVAGAPLLTQLYLGSQTRANAALTTAFAYLLLPGIVFYGMSALLAAILNVRGIFGPPAWAPVVNNLVVIATVGLYAAVPGEISTDPVRMGQPKLLILGIGTALGITLQAVTMVAVLKRTGFRFRWRWGWDRRLSEFGSLAFWVLIYTIFSQIGMMVAIRVTSQGTPGSVSTFHYAWLLSQMPYGVLGVSLLTALMPRISRAATEQDTGNFVNDLSLGTRMSTVLLMPISALMLVAGGAIGIAFFSLGAGSVAAADRLGVTLGFFAAGMVPFAITMLQLRAFYALKDSRTPAIINAIMVAVRCALFYVFLAVLDPQHLVVGVAVAMSLSFLLGAVVGQIWLHVRLGRLHTGSALLSIGRAAAASGVACAAAVGAVGGIHTLTGPLAPIPDAWLTLGVHSTVILVVSFGLLALFRAPELTPATERLRRILRRE